ncbi:MAG: EAL domain-containing protein [Proteobacteria bacterium]|nr:EAL domain-containing protein [Pseudomonadota bacterium]
MYRSWQEGINRILGLVLEPVPFDEKLKRITDGVVETFGADFCRIWIIGKGDLCSAGCMHAEALEEPHVCRYRDKCLYLKASSGRYTHIDGKVHRRVPFGTYKIGRIASGEEIRFLTNNVQRDPRVHDNEWAKNLGLVAFAGYQLRPQDGETLGVLALFAKFEISPDMDATLEGLSEAIALVIQKDIAERALAESEWALIQIKKAVESSGEAIGMANPQGSHFYQNKAFLDLFEYSVEELNKPLEPIVTYADPEVGREVFETIMQGSPWVGETIMVAKGGRRFPVFLRADAVKDDNGNIIGLIGIHTDITERKQAEEALQKSEEKYRYLVDNMNDGIYIIDEKGTILFANNALASIHGFDSPDKLLNKCFIEFVEPSARKEILKSYKNGIQSGKMFNEIEIPIISVDGSMVYVLIRPFIIRDGERITSTGGIVRDITERRRAEEALHRSETKFRTLYDSSSDAVMLLDEKGFFDCNKATLAIFGCATQEEFSSKHPAILSPPQQPCGTDSMVLANQMIATAMEKGSIRFEWTHKRNDTGETFPAEVLLTAMELDGKQVVQAVVRDITERKHTEDRIQYLATHDVLTGLPNRSMFSQLLNHAIQAAQRYQRQFAVLFIDLDRFKIINDTLGHEAGDQLLQEIATRLKQPLRAVDIVGRLGGDEFIILIEEVNELSQVTIVANKILTSIIKPITLMGQKCRITASIGICMYPKDAEDEQSLMKNADIAMYLAKEEGKNNYQFYSEDIQSKSLERLSIETNLRFALERNELSLHYQAKVDFKTNAITGVEALLRWQNPYLGSVTPTQFIPVAEETGLIMSMGRWVLKTACAQNVAWQQQGLPAVCMAVNLSLRQLTDDNLINDIGAALKDSGMAPNLLELEITESMVMHNPAHMISVLAKIKSMGVRLAIDDFGTGYSSLAQIKHFPIDTLKVDRSFIRNIPKDAEDRAITEAIIAMGKTLSLTVVAEGVETVEQMNFLKEHSCDEMQGYYFSKPIVPEQFADLLRKHAPSPLK